MGLPLFIVAYLVYLAFWCRIAWHIVLWYRASRRYPAQAHEVQSPKCGYIGAALLDLFFFRRLFSTNKLLWIGSWTFHISFVFAVVGHLRYFLDPVPAFITFIQPSMVVAGYLLPSSLLYLIVLRIAGRKRYVGGYVSRYNFFLLGTLFLISTTGYLMHHYFVPDLVEIKGFIMNLLRFRDPFVPDDFLFLLHFGLVLLLAPYLPTHFFSAPFVLLEARKQERELEKFTHA